MYSPASYPDRGSPGQSTIRRTFPVLPFRRHRFVSGRCPMEENPYEVLGCEETASYDQLKRAYQRLVRAHHPDKAGRGDEEAREAFVRIDRAWKTLGSAGLRERFDLRRREGRMVQEWPVQEEVDFEGGFALDRESGNHAYPCRCGGRYLLSSPDADSRVDAVCCDTCSLAIRVLYRTTTTGGWPEQQ